MNAIARLIKNGADARILANSHVFNSFQKIRELTIEQKFKIAKKYLRSEKQELVGSDGIFDIEFYKSQFPSKSPKPYNFLLHYLKIGHKRGLWPHFLFDLGYYRHEAQKKGYDIDVEPFEHYCKVGAYENISPSMYFDNDWYRSTYLGRIKSPISPLEHFLSIGSSNGYSVSPFFLKDRIESYLGKEAGTTIDALKKYLMLSKTGVDIDPHPLFDARFYSKNYPDVVENDVNPLAHFTAYGLGERRITIPLDSFPVGIANEQDRLQFKFINFSEYFKTKEIFTRYTYLDKLVHAIRLGKQKHKKRPLAIIAAYNDDDCIEYILRAAIREGLSLWLIDNWSNDRTFEIMTRLSKEPGTSDFIENVERFPAAGPSDQYDWHGILERKQTIASKFPGRWILHQDSDEITVSIVANATCAETLHAIAEAGYNAVNMRMFDFRPIDRSEPRQNLEDHFKFFEFSDKPGYGSQMKAWLQPETTIDLAGSGGHYAQFEGIKAYPLRLPRKHYALRSVSHARRKITVERLPRFEKERKEKGWHTHYDDNFDESKFIWDRERLQHYTATAHSSVWFEKLFNDDYVTWI